MKAVELLTHVNYDVVNAFRDGKPIEIMSPSKAILIIGDLEISDFWIENDSLGFLNVCIYLK